MACSDAVWNSVLKLMCLQQKGSQQTVNVDFSLKNRLCDAREEHPRMALDTQLAQKLAALNMSHSPPVTAKQRVVKYQEMSLSKGYIANKRSN